MAEGSRGWIVVLTVSSLIGLLAVVGQDAGPVLFQVFFVVLLGLGCLSFLISVCYPRLQTALTRHSQVQAHDNARTDHQEQFNRVRDALQEEHVAKATAYSDRILKPRQEARLKQKEDDFRRNMGPAWQGQGNKLGTVNPASLPKHKGPGGSREAAISRNLPEPEPQPQEPTVAPLVRKKVIELPSEPAEASEGHVTVMLRTPQGRFYNRRFHSSNTVQVLFDYMTTIGYHQKLYTLITSYPRQTLDGACEKTLAEMTITKRVTLNVDRRDPD